MQFLRAGRALAIALRAHAPAALHFFFVKLRFAYKAVECCSLSAAASAGVWRCPPGTNTLANFYLSLSDSSAGRLFASPHNPRRP